jgi:hypothetical protein
MKNIPGLGSLVVGSILLLILGSYLLGATKILVDDHRYDSKDVVIGFIFPPYPVWVGGKELYKLATTTSEFRDKENRCLKMPLINLLSTPKSKLSFCKCLAVAKTEQEGEQCGVDLFNK